MRSIVADPLSPFYVVSYRRRSDRKLVDITHRASKVSLTHTGTRKTNKMDVNLDNADQSLFSNSDLMKKGTILTCTFGYPGNTVNAGEFAIKTQRASRTELSIAAHEAKRSTMLRRTRSRVFEDQRRSDVVRIVLLDHGFDGFIGEPTDEVLPTITQTRDETDWEFLQRLARLENREFFLATDGAHWEKPRRKQAPARLLRYVKNSIGVGHILEWSADSVETGLPGRIIMKGWDPLTGREFSVQASDDDTELDRLSQDTDFFDPDEGDRDASGTIGRDLTLNIEAVTESDAKRRVDSLYKELRYSALKMDVTCIGDPTLRARQVILIEGIGPALDGAFWVKEVIHTLGEGGYQCSLKLTRDGLNKIGRRSRPKRTATQKQPPVRPKENNAWALGTANQGRAK